MTRAVALENADMDITCNAICPGTLATPGVMGRIRKKAASEGVSEAEAIRRYLAGRQPDDRFIALENVAATIVLLSRSRRPRRHRRGATITVNTAIAALSLALLLTVAQWAARLSSPTSQADG